MIVSCEDCGKQYRVHTEKMRADSAQFRCRACGHTIAVNKPLPPADESTELSPSTLTLGKAKPAALPGEQSEPLTPDRQKVPAMKLKGIGIRTKLMFFLLVPLIAALVVGGYFSLKQMVDLSDLITHESSKIVSQMAEQEIADHARAVAL